VRGGRDDVCVLERSGHDVCGNQAAEVRDVGQQVSVYLVGNLTEAGKVKQPKNGNVYLKLPLQRISDKMQVLDSTHLE
jgi:hypothetical protein